MADRLGLGVSDLVALDLLLQSPRLLGPVELGHRLGIRSASATTLVDRLEHAGHIVRTADPVDRRRQALVVTDHARIEARTALGPMIADLHRAAADLTNDEAEAVVRYLESAAEIMRAHADDAAPPTAG
jgi:DNA-binding MarR family transcriptional regulator